MGDGVEFGDLPPAYQERGTSKWSRAAEELRDRPGEWARVNTLTSPHSARAFASNLRRGYGMWAPRGAYQATARGRDVWARYIGDES